MENKTNQKKKAYPEEEVSKPMQEKAKAVDTSELEHNEEEAPFPSSLNQELEELLKKNPGRFFGGCGG